MPNDKETVTLKLPGGEMVDFVVPGGMSDAQVKTFVLSKRPDLFSTIPGAPNGLPGVPKPTVDMQQSGGNLFYALTAPKMGLESGLPSPAQVPENVGPMQKGAAVGSFIANPITTAGTLGGSYLAGKGNRAIAQKLGAGETGQNIAERVGNVAGALVGGGTSGAIADKFNPVALRSSAGGTLGNIKSQAGKIPVNVGDFGDTALELWTQNQRGAPLPQAVRKLVNRLTAPGGEPLTYAEAKDFQSNITSLLQNPVADSTGALKNPSTYRLVTNLNQGLKSSLEKASQVGGFEPGTFSNAMQQYHQAGKIQDATEFTKEAMMNIIKEGAKLAARGAGLGAGIEGYQAIRGKK